MAHVRLLPPAADDGEAPVHPSETIRFQARARVGDATGAERH